MTKGATAGWGTPEEVPAAEMGGGPRRRTERQRFITDLFLRLERTRSDRALRYTFTAEAEARQLIKYVTSTTRRERGNGQLCTAVRRLEDGRVAVYLARGPRYNKREEAE